MFEKHGNKIIFFGRLLPTIRSLISFPAGVAKMNLGVFTVYSLAGSVVWSCILVSAGYLLGDGWEKTIEWISGYEKGALIAVGVAILIYAGYSIYKKISKRNN
jgi:membrane protein DedA with SNARE-associated domain